VQTRARGLAAALTAAEETKLYHHDPSAFDALVGAGSVVAKLTQAGKDLMVQKCVRCGLNVLYGQRYERGCASMGHEGIRRDGGWAHVCIMSTTLFTVMCSLQPLCRVIDLLV
jgi:hypothetical protein